ncbi:MAG: ABC transporter ATP-binding protein, partial [Elusimicrobia bacterium]|nr:ABC transporter ATP-binding protein [Elusimicrobiota bacterium]
GLICALLHDPLMLVLDEPTIGVDPVSRRQLWELLYGLKLLVIISTSYMDEAQRCARVHLLNEGRLILSGEPKEILAGQNAANFEEMFLNLEKQK